MKISGSITHVIFTLILFFCACSKTPENPNVIILLADDMGYTDPHYMGGSANTPNLDRLARSGISFTNLYAGAPNCSPSRAALLTGKIPARTGIYNYRDVNSVMHLREEEITLAEMLKRRGYQTVHLGKWHLGALNPNDKFNHPQPFDQGFDYFFGTENNAIPSHLNPVNFIRNGEALGELEGYSCQIIADEFIHWFENNYDPGRPFFHYIAFHEPHRKVASPRDLVAHYQGMNVEDAEYMANIENLDMAIGRIVSYLLENNLYDNTLIFFASDNGPYRQGSQGDLRGLKSWVYDGGIKVPGFIHWPALFKDPYKLDTPVWFEDIFPTLCNVTGKECPDQNLDGQNILSLLNKESWKRNKPMLWFFYRTYPEVALRMNDYNIVGFSNDSMPHNHWFTDQDMEFVKTIHFDSFQMYNLLDDPVQKNDLKLLEKDKYNEMKKLLTDKFQAAQIEFPDWPDIQEYLPEKGKMKYQREEN